VTGAKRGRRPGRRDPNTPTSPLRQALLDAKAEHGYSMGEMTVLTADNDPFRQDTPANRIDAQWLVDTVASLGGIDGRKIHLRGLHYMILGSIKPDGTVYVNNDDTWEWLRGGPGKVARWLGYIGFDQFTDQRNAAPVVRIFQQPEPEPYVSGGIDVEIPDADDLLPGVDVENFTGAQPFKLAIVGEKSSLEPVLAPIAEAYQADLYLPTGNISDTLIYQMAKVGAEDGRPMVAFYFADADPSGWNMGIEVARKLQALQALHFPDLEFQVRRVALTPDQVREYGLPSTPLKETEKRADRWVAAFGVEQTEVDALAALRPDLLRTIAHEAIGEFYDRNLNQRVREARNQWRDAAQEVIEEALGDDRLEHREAETRLAAMQEEVDALNEAVRVDIDDLDLPDIEIPEADTSLGENAPDPLIDSQWGFVEQTQRLIESKAY
jgi:hypothetical protein